MNALKALAGVMMRCATAIAPQEQADRMRAMTAELSASRSDRAAVGWALGCLSVAIGWRVRVDLSYCLALGLGITLAPYLFVALLMVPNTNPVRPLLAALCTAALFLPGVAVSIYWPKRVVLTSLIVLCSMPGAFNVLTAVLVSTPFSLLSGHGLLHGMSWIDWLSGFSFLIVELALSFGAAFTGLLVGKRFIQAY